MIAVAQKFEENLINSFVPNVVFEDLGFKYVGPIDGHDISRMSNIFRQVSRNMVGPVLIHVVTKKGKGYGFAEEDAPRFHGLGPFEVETGRSISVKDMSYSKHFGTELSKIASRNKKLVAITAAMADGTGLVGFSRKFPDRFFDVGICEQHAVTFAGGLAVEGMKPFVAIYSTFLQRAYDQVIHDIALQRLPVVFCLDRAGLVGEDGATHHGAFDLSYLRLVPNLILMAPAYAEEFSEMLKLSASYKKGPIAIRYPRGKAVFEQNSVEPVKIGKFEVRKTGKKVALIGIGAAFLDMKLIYEQLLKELPGIDFYLINARFVKPLDEELLNSLKEDVEHIFTLEDNSLIGGFGSAIKEFYADSNMKVYSFGIPDKFITHGSTKDLKRSIQVTPAQVRKNIINILNKL